MSGKGPRAGGASAGGVGGKRKRPDDASGKPRGRSGPPGGAKGGPRGDSKGPRGDSKGPRGDSKGPRGPRGDSKGPRGDSKGPRGDSKGPRTGGSKGPRGDSKGGPRKPFSGKRDGDKSGSSSSGGGPAKGAKLAPGVYKGSKPHAELNDKLVRHWNELRERATPKARKEELVKDVLSMITGRVMDVVMRHDASRVVQACLKHGSAAQRDSVCREMFGHALELTKAKHGHQLIEKMLLYGSPAVRTQLARELKGHVARLVTHNIGALVVETGFAKAWPPATCWELYQELLGSEWVHMKADAACGRTLGGLLAAHPTKRKAVFESMFYILSKQADKKLFGLHVAHRLLADFLEHAPPEQAVGMLGLARDHILALCTTREGARAAAALWGLATPKDRKAMWKSWKGRLFDLATHEHGHLALVAALDVTDDTRTSGDALWEELRPHVALLALHKHARKVLLHLLAPRSPRYFSVFDLKVLAPVTLPAYLANRKAPAGEGDAAPAAAPAAGGAGAAAAAAPVAEGKPETGEAALAASAAAAAIKASGKREREPLAIPAPPPAEIAGDAAAMAPTATSKKADAQRRGELLAPIRGDLESALLTHTGLLGRSEYGMGVLYEGALWLRASAPAAAAAAAAAAAKAEKGGKKGAAAAAGATGAAGAGAAGPSAAAGSAAVSDGRAVFEAIADLLVEEPTADELQEQLAALQAASVAASVAVPAELGGSGGGGVAAAVDAAAAPAAKRARKDDEAAAEGDAAAAEGDADADEKDGDEEDDEAEEDEDDESEAEDAAPAAGGAGKAGKPGDAKAAAAVAEDEPVDIFLPFAEHPPSHLLLKWLLQRESTRNTDAAAGAGEEPVFGPLAQARLAGKLTAMCGSSRGAFIALELLQSRHAATAAAVRAELSAASAMAALKGYKYKPDAGLVLLLERLTGTARAVAPAKGAAAAAGSAASTAATATPGGKKGKMDVDAAPAGGAGSAAAAAAPKSAAKEVAPKSAAKAAEAPAPKSAAKSADSGAAAPPKSAAKSRPASARK